MIKPCNADGGMIAQFNFGTLKNPIWVPATGRLKRFYVASWFELPIGASYMIESLSGSDVDVQVDGVLFTLPSQDFLGCVR
jgi:hypothetical protein